MPLLIATAAIVAVLLALTYLCFRRTFYVNKKALADPHQVLPGEQYKKFEPQTVALVDDALTIPCEDVYAVSHDGFRLHAKYYEKRKGAPVQILIHGYRSIAIRDFAGGLHLALASDCNVLLIDQRAHGESEGRCLSFGVLERLDCLTWINYLTSKLGDDTKIVLVGISMGAATVLMTAGLDLPKNVVGIVADSAYTSPAAIIRKVIGDMHLPVAPLYPFVRLSARLFGGFGLQSCGAVTSVASCRVPVLFFHGESDTFVPCDMSRELFAACPSEKTLITVPGADHGLEFLVDGDTYRTELMKFLSAVLPREE